MRVFGRTGMRLSVLGFGCGAVGGLMVRGDWRDQERTVARAIGTTSTLRCSMAMENRRKISALSRKSSNRPTWWWALRSGCGAKTSGTFRHRDKVARRQFGAIALERVDVFHLHIGAAEKRSASGRCSTRWCHTRASYTGKAIRFPWTYGDRRHRSAASGDRSGRLRRRSGCLQHAQSLRGHRAAAKLSGTRLLAAVRSYQDGR